MYSMFTLNNICHFHIFQTVESISSSIFFLFTFWQYCKVHPFGNIDFSFVFEIIVRKSQLDLQFSFCIFSFLTERFLYRMPIVT